MTRGEWGEKMRRYTDKERVMDKKAMDRTLTRMAHEILERNVDAKHLAIVGIKTRGAHIAKRLVEKIEEIDGIRVPSGTLDITRYRDDVQAGEAEPEIHETEIPFDVTGKRLVLVDDVLFTGRTVRAALDALIDRGRPAQVQLAVFVDRGHREFPIRPDYVGRTIPTSNKEMVRMRVKEVDGIDQTAICESI